MEPIFTVLIAVGATLLLLFLIYLCLIMPSLKRRAEIKKFAGYRYAHRGLHGDGAAENSLTAVRRAVEAGYGIELDIRLSRDGEVVVFHDNTLDRIAGVSGRVDSYDYAELKEMHLSGTEDTVPLFTDALAAVDGRVPLLIELKEEAGKYDVTEKALEILKEYKGDYIIESFNPLALGRVKKKKPEILRGIISMNYMAEKNHRKPLFFLLQLLVFNAVCRPHFISYDHKQYKNTAFRLCRALFGVTAFAWTVRSHEEEENAYRHGFDTVIFENYPAKKETDQ